MMEMNSSIVGVAAVAQVNPLIFTVLIALIIIFVLFVLVKRFRQFIYGCMVTVPLIVIFKVSYWIVQENLSGNAIPTKYLIFGAVFVMWSVIVGIGVNKYSFFKKVDASFFRMKKDKRSKK